jgi:PKD repeat protein
MKKLIALLIGVLATVTGQAAAQGPVEVIVHDACLPYYWGENNWEWILTCDSYLMTPDGSTNVLVGDGVHPVISPDAGRIAFVGDEEPGIFVVNLSDWSHAKVSSFGESPVWSRDGMKLAFVAGGLYAMAHDGSGVRQLTAEWAGHPAWSPDGLTIAFDCEVESGNRDICSINIDGTGLVRLTSDPAWDASPEFSADGLTIAFITTRYGMVLEVAVMNLDGTGVSRVGPPPNVGAQSPDGTRIVFVVPAGTEGIACNADGGFCWETLDRIYLMNADGSDRRMIAWGNNPMWALALRPVASFVSQGCSGLTCSFDGSASWGGNGTIRHSWDFGDGTTDVGPTVIHEYTAPGTYTVTLTAEDSAGVVGTQSTSLDVIGNVPPTAAFTYVCRGWWCTLDGSASSDPDDPIASYFWDFGDGDISSMSATVSHRYDADGTFTVSLTVTDGNGGTDTQQHILNIVNAPPVASFTPVCIALTCALNGSGSSDVDGTVASYLWNFGDGTSGSDATVSHTYAEAGNYTVTLSVTDDAAATNSQTQSLTVVRPEMHVGDLDGVSTSTQNTWTAIVSVVIHDRSHGGVANATVTGSWNDGSTASCTTSTSGQCVVSRSGIPKKTNSASFSVTNVTRSPFVYAPAADHDPDGSSSGRTVSVIRP